MLIFSRTSDRWICHVNYHWPYKKVKITVMKDSGKIMKKRTVKLKRIVIIYGSFISELYSFILISLCRENIQMIVVMHVYIVYSNWVFSSINLCCSFIALRENYRQTASRIYDWPILYYTCCRYKLSKRDKKSI